MTGGIELQVSYQLLAWCLWATLALQEL